MFFRRTIDPDIWCYTIGGSERALIRSSLWEWDTEFSQDGSRIVFASNRNCETMTIWTANADGTNPKQLTSRAGQFYEYPRWSPDGLSIAFDSRGEDGQFDIFVIDSRGGQPLRITSEPSNEQLPIWLRDGRWIYFRSDRTGANEIWRTSSHGGLTEQVTTDGGFTAIESTDRSSIFYTKTEAGALFTRPLAGGQERRLIDRVGPGFSVTKDGIYYFGRKTESGSPILFYEFSSDTSSLITSVKGVFYARLAVAPDCKTFLFSKVVTSGNDLMLIENFR